MSGLCKDCKWWDVDAFGEDDPQGICNLANQSDKLEAYGDGLEAFLATAPDFGCNQFSQAKQ